MSKQSATTPQSKPFDYATPITLLAFILALVMVTLRITLPETLRDSISFGSADLPGPRATTTLVFDLICWVPALLVLVRRAIDPTYTLRMHVSHALMALLAGWVVASTFWAGDRFQSVITASTWCAAMALGWAMCQLVRSWLRFRIVAALALGVLLIFVANSLIYQFVEVPDMRASWPAMKQRMLEDRNQSAEDSFIKMYEGKVLRGEMMGFFRSPNVFAAAIALTALTATGLALQRVRDRDEWGFPVAIGVPALASLPVLYLTQSRTAMAGLVLCAGLFALAWWKRETLIRKHRPAFLIACGVIALGVAVLLAIGLTTGGLLHDSMNFRWHYWVGSWGIVKKSPLLGVGWGDFGNAYLATRLPIAAEEIKDPHNFLMKFMTETGVIGALLALAWLGRSAWEAARPVLPRHSPGKPTVAVSVFVIVPVAYAVVRFFYDVDILKTPLFGFLLAFGVILGSVRSSKDLISDDRPAELALWGVLVALAGFLLHAMVDFAMFETGPLLLMMLLLGSVLGLRHPGAAGQKPWTRTALAGLAAVFFVMVAFVALVLIPVAGAESKASQAMSLVSPEDPRKTPPNAPAAVALLREAFVNSPVPNAEYASRAATLMRSDKLHAPDPERVIELLTLAINANPRDAGAWISRGSYRMELPLGKLHKPDDVVADYVQALSRNPADLTSRKALAIYLSHVNRPADAAEQFRKLLDYNDKLAPGEPRRLAPQDVEALRKAIASLDAAPTTQP